jgi:hypothetical protein
MARAPRQKPTHSSYDPWLARHARHDGAPWELTGGGWTGQRWTGQAPPLRGVSARGGQPATWQSCSMTSARRPSPRGQWLAMLKSGSEGCRRRCWRGKQGSWAVRDSREALRAALSTAEACGCQPKRASVRSIAATGYRLVTAYACSMYDPELTRSVRGGSGVAQTAPRRLDRVRRAG